MFSRGEITIQHVVRSLPDTENKLVLGFVNELKSDGLEDQTVINTSKGNTLLLAPSPTWTKSTSTTLFTSLH
jgi:hypothetical protein